MHQLRQYQLDAIESLFSYWATEGGNGLIEMATGTGKSLVMAELIHRLVRQYDGFKVVVAAHVSELISQNFSELENIWPLAPAGIYSAALGQRRARDQISFVSIQTVFNKAEAFGAVDLLLIDECHLVAPKANTMYGRFISDLRSANPDMRIAGLTATPFRLGSGRLDQGPDALFNKITFRYGISEGVRDGHLTRLVSKATETGFDLTGVGKSKGDYIPGQLQAACDKTETTRRAIDEAVAYGKDRKSWLAFCSGVEHSFHVRDEIRSRGFSCETITGETPFAERTRILAEFKAGKIRCVTNNSVMTTGTNIPNIDMILALRPTTSPGLYIQALGRGTRNSPGKENCLVLDYARLVATHGPIDMVKSPKEKGSGPSPIKECPTCHSLIHASLMVCPDCSHVFPPSAVSKLTAKASALAVMGDAPPEWVRVTGRTFTMVYRPKDTALLQATFVCGQVKHRAWFMPEYGGRKGNKADKFWLEHGGKSPYPRTAVSWISRQAELAPTSEINIKPDGARMKVLDSRAVLVLAADIATAGDLESFAQKMWERKQAANKTYGSKGGTARAVAAE